ncbi:hypothetical protein MTO96_032554 [Rhipicephalus appendiculatus]
MADRAPAFKIIDIEYVCHYKTGKGLLYINAKRYLDHRDAQIVVGWMPYMYLLKSEWTHEKIRSAIINIRARQQRLSEFTIADGGCKIDGYGYSCEELPVWKVRIANRNICDAFLNDVVATNQGRVRGGDPRLSIRKGTYDSYDPGIPRSIPYELNSLPQMNCGGACTVKTPHGFVIAIVYISPGTSRSDVMNFLLQNLRAVCLQDVPVIVTGDFNVNVPRCENQWLVMFLDAELGLRLLSDVTQPTTHNTTCLDIVFGKGVASGVQCVPLPTYFSDHKAVLAVVD